MPHLAGEFGNMFKSLKNVHSFWPKNLFCRILSYGNDQEYTQGQASHCSVIHNRVKFEITSLPYSSISVGLVE